MSQPNGDYSPAVISRQLEVWGILKIDTVVEPIFNSKRVIPSYMIDEIVWER